MTTGAQAAGAGATTTASPAIDLRDVTVRFTTKRKQVTALQDVTVRAAAGEFVSIVGPSGCGKSTLLKIAAGLTAPTTGTAAVLGEPVDGPRHDIGYVFQRAALLEWRSARRNILLQAEMRGMSRDEAGRRADALIELVGLAGFADAMPHELSGGRQQRVSLCRALLHEPPVLLMDEPFGALDALTREQMNVELHRIWRETGTTVLFVTHSIAEAVYLSNRVVVLGARPGHVLEVLEIDLPPVRDYAETVASPVFAHNTRRLRELLKATGDHE